ncbi:hypothetical protein HDU86_002724 [Geranomyces michiganensis]|nr:hypothetical protein HDU86_002724 [Geranomyces michiganensis]
MPSGGNVTPLAVPSTITPQRTESGEELPPSDGEVARVYEELAGKHLELAGMDVGQILRKILQLNPKPNLMEVHGPTHLALNKCLLLSRVMPALFEGACSRMEWAEFESRRMLTCKTEIAGKALRPMVEKWEAEVRKGATIWVPKINRADESACRLLACVVALSQHLGPEDAAPICEPTWTHNLVAPYMSFIEDPELKVKFDSTTAYSIKRPDVQIILGTRVATCAEIKPKQAKPTEKKKDQARVVKSAMHYISADALNFELADDSVRLALWCPGDEVFVYEVVGYASGLFVAVEIARFSLPTALRPSTISMVAEAIGWFSAVADRVHHIARRMCQTPHDLEARSHGTWTMSLSDSFCLDFLGIYGI